MMMDKSATQDIRVIPLKNANAVEVLTRFKEMMGQIYQQAGKGAINEVFAATADERTNSLIVAGTPAVFEAVTKVLAELDVAPSDANTITTAMFPLVRGNASSVVAAINALYVGRPNVGGMPPPKATAEPVANVVYITGTQSQIDQLKATVIDPLEQYAPGGAIKQYQIPIQYAKVEDVAETLNNWFTQRFAALRAAGGAAKAPAEMVVNIIAVPATRQLLVSCSEDNKAVIDDLLKSLDNEQVSDLGQQVKVIPVKFADLGYTALALTTAFTKAGKVPESEKITITPEYGTQSLIIKARASDLAEIEKLLAQIDRSDSTNITPPETVRLGHAKASEVANTVMQMVVRGKRRDRVTGLYPVNVSADDTSNTLLVTANNKKEMDEAKAMIGQLDTQPATDIERALQSYPLLYADLGSVMQAINTRFADNAKMPVQHQVSVTPDYTTNALLVTASVENHKKVEAIIKELDQSNVASMRAPETIKVVNIKASDLANTLTQMIRTSKKVDKRTGQYPVTVAGNDASNTLLVTANATDMAEMKTLIAKLDVPMDEADQRIIRPYPVKYVDLSAMIQVINSRFEGGKTRSIKDQVQALAETATNSVVVTASAENHEKVKVLIEQLDQESGGTVQQEIIRLANARADDLATVVQTTYRTRKLRPGEQPPTITADTNSNSIVVSASLNQIQAIKELIAELDKPVDPSRVEELRVIPLQYVDAIEVKDILTEYLRKPGIAPGRGPAALVNDVRLQVSPSMNALVVSGASADIERVQTLTQTMDKEDLAGSSSVPQIVQVQHTSASQLAATLSRMFTEPAQVRARGKTGGADLVPLIMADDATNTLVVKARTVDFNQIKDMVAKLDTEQIGRLSGVELIPVSRGTDVNALAREIERTINQGELVRARQQPGYKPAAVAVGVDERGPALIVAGSPELFPTIKSLVAKLQSFTPAGGYTARIIPVRNIPAQDMKRVIQQLIDQQQGGSQSGRPRR
jgi:type II secretory pathway component GspD/PulD (secretin)